VQPTAGIALRDIILLTAPTNLFPSGAATTVAEEYLFPPLATTVNSCIDMMHLMIAI